MTLCWCDPVPELFPARHSGAVGRHHVDGEHLVHAPAAEAFEIESDVGEAETVQRFENASAYFRRERFWELFHTDFDSCGSLIVMPYPNRLECQIIECGFRDIDRAKPRRFDFHAVGEP